MNENEDVSEIHKEKIMQILVKLFAKHNEKHTSLRCKLESNVKLQPKQLDVESRKESSSKNPTKESEKLINDDQKNSKQSDKSRQSSSSKQKMTDTNDQKNSKQSDKSQNSSKKQKNDRYE